MDRMSLFVSAGAAVLIGLFLQTPAQFGNSFSSYYWILNTGRATAASRVEPEVHTSKSRDVKAAVVSVQEEEPEVVGAGLEFSFIADPVEQPAPAELPPSAPPITIVSNAVYLYTLNHAGSPVLSALPKGEIVEPLMTVNENGQEWTYVLVPVLRVSGYLPSDSLEQSGDGGKLGQ